MAETIAPTAQDPQTLSLGKEEFAAVEAHFRTLKREPTPAELKTISQAWSSCRRDTLGPIRYNDGKKTVLIKNLFEHTASLRPFGRGALDFAVEVCEPSCIVEPCGAAQAATASAIGRAMSANLGAKPVLAATAFFCAPPVETGPQAPDTLPARRILEGAVLGARDYTNRLGVPMAAGALWLDEAYRQDPLILCGAVGFLPVGKSFDKAKPGDLIVAAGSRTDRGCGPNVRLTRPLNAKKLLDALLTAREKKLHRSQTFCSAGGLALAVLRLAGGQGARLSLEKVKLASPDLKPLEIWLSETPERMVFSVPPQKRKAFEEVFTAEDCETAVLGEITATGRLEASFQGAPAVSLDMRFLLEGRPHIEKKAVWQAHKPAPVKAPVHKKALAQILGECLSHFNVCSREWIIRQYDHEAQAGTLIKPLQGVRHDGPGDACVIRPAADISDWRSFAVSHGLNPAYGRLDPSRMAMACADEALRNLICVGADVSRAALCANFSWSGPDNPAKLGALVRAALGLRDAARGFGVPFMSEKISFRSQGPGTLLVSALAPVPDARKALTLDIKGPGNALYLVGWTSEELGGSLFHEICGRCLSCAVPATDPRSAMTSFKAVFSAMAKGLVLSAHDLAAAGLGVCAAQMCFSGEFGAVLDLDKVPRRAPIYSDEVLLFSESTSRILLEVATEREAAFLKAMRGTPVKRVGTTMANPVLKVTGLDGRICMEADLGELKAAWQEPLPRRLG